MKSFKTFITEESYTIPIKTVDDAKSFKSKVGFSNLEKILNKSFEILSKYPDASPKTYSDVPLAGGDGGGIKIRLNSNSKGFIEMKEYISSIGAQSIGYGAGSIKFTDGINWTAPVLETCLCLGVYINGDSLIRDFKAIKDDRSSLPYLVEKWSDIILSTLINGEDWNNKGASAVIRFIKKGIGVKDWVTLGMLANGMTTFANGPGKGLNHIIHGRVNDYYSAEESNHHIEVNGNKANTADMILSSVPANELIKMVSSEEIRFDSSSGMCYIGKAKFLQVSLKKSIKGTQLGKVTDLIKNMYGIRSSSDILNSVLLKEGFFDFAKKFGKTVSKYIQGAINKISKYFNSFFKKVASDYDRQQKKDLLYLEQVLNLKEGSLYNGNTLLERKLTINETLRGLSENQVGIIVNEIEKRANKLESTANGIGHISFLSKGRIINKSTTLEDRIKLLANLTTFEILSNMVNRNGGDLKSLAEDIGSIQKEMLFGKTTLPLYKVYGSEPGGDSYEFLSTGKEFVNKFETSVDGNLMVMGILISPKESGSYYVMSSAFFVSVDETGDPLYSENRMGTNKAGRFTYVFEGTKFLTLEEFNKKFR